MHYIFVTLLLFALLLVYFKIADKYNIIDKPNHRSAHSEITLRGGGVVFPIAFLLFAASYFLSNNSFLSPQNYLIFGIGLFLTSILY
jgi:UDP-N-acetylmuramyl pentapeptide phosphotransferase/UDP-N-acetylglucosamine-1-phosphate transferase